MQNCRKLIEFTFVIMLFQIISVSGKNLQNCNTNKKRVIKIEFNEKGQIISTPPVYLTKDDNIQFIVNTSQDFQQKRVIETYQRFNQTISTLSDMNGTKYKVLETLGLENSTDAVKMIKITIGKLSQQLSLFVDDHVDDLKDQINPTNVKQALKTNSDMLSTFDATEKALIQTPSMNNLIYPAYFVKGKIVNVNGLDIISDCNATCLLTYTKGSCGGIYSGTPIPLTFKDGPVRFEFELRMDNNIAKELKQQVLSSAALAPVMSIINTNSLAQQIKDALDLSKLNLSSVAGKVSDADIVILAKGITTKEKDPKTDMVAMMASFTSEKTRIVYDLIYDLYTKWFNYFSQELKIAWMFQFAWVTGGQNISANPFFNGTIVGIGQQLSDLNKTLVAQKKDSLNFVAKLALLENSSKAANSAINIKELSDEYNIIQKEKSDNEALIDATNNKIIVLKKQGSSDVINQLSKSSLLSDSLLYQGLFYINNIGNYNKKYYAFMRNHDALEDYQLKGKKPVNGINETQRLYILIDNALPTAKYLLKTTITTINLSDDIPPSGSEINTKGVAELSSPLINRKNLPSPDDIFQVYELLKKLYAPYINGILVLPIKQTLDVTPDYITRVVPHESPVKAPSLVNYSIIDSVGKNLNSEGTIYTYRFNKLYRFRLKAGFSYSWLNNRTYTINSSINTATYVNNITGLAPCFGLQIFTTRLDIQSTGFFPHGAAPFFYLGYLFNNSSAANLLVGAGYEVFSGFAFTAGVHFGKSQELTLVSGALQEKDYYKPAAFISFSIGLEAFNAIFNTAKPTVNPFK